jgi:hypothetical protein
MGGRKMVRSKEDIDNFMVEITTLSRKYGTGTL